MNRYLRTERRDGGQIELYEIHDEDGDEILGARVINARSSTVSTIIARDGGRTEEANRNDGDGADFIFATPIPLVLTTDPDDDPALKKPDGGINFRISSR